MIINATRRIRSAMDAGLSDIKEMGLRVPTPEGWGDLVSVHGNRLRIYTRFSRDTRLMNNGGDYDFWTEVWEQDGKLHVSEEWSADFDARQWLGDVEVFDVSYAQLCEEWERQAKKPLPALEVIPA